MTVTNIRNDLKEIRYYYARKAVFDNASQSVGQNPIVEKVRMYNDKARLASPRLYDLYISLYLENNTLESLADKMGYTYETLSRLNSQLVKFLQNQFNEPA